jgi:glycyl-tRNA synthetase beta chain
MADHSLLIELGTEELPTHAVDELAGAFADAIATGLEKRGIAADAAARDVYASPRRLAVRISRVASLQPDQENERRGPALSAGLDASGQPSKALQGFAASCGVAVDALQKLETDKGAWFVHRSRQPGLPTAELLPEIIADAIKSLPIPKPMRWGDHAFAFVRPLHWLVVLHGDAVVPVEVFGIASGRDSRGHRFHHPHAVAIAHADGWLDALRAAYVLADPRERRERVRAEIDRVGAQIGAHPRLRDALLDEIANLTEWPVALAGTFDRDFLRVPQEALIMTMETNQKFVPVFDAGGALTEHFIGVANIASRDPGEIRRGYERVIRPRFADASFFFDEDGKTPLAAQQEPLKNVTYQQSLGSVWDKCVRVAELARVIANRAGVDAASATRAAALSKCDLMTRMVGEFPELQGVMGRYYASAQGEPAAIATALDEFYAPRFAGDAIAQGDVARVLAVAERLDTLAGIFAVGLKPTGNKDPFALRRAALGLARTLIEAGLALDLPVLLAEALDSVPDDALAAGLPRGKDGKAPPLDAGARRKVLASELYEFVVDRLRGYYADQGIASEAFEAVRALAPASLLDFDRRLRAVVDFARLPEAQALAAANKRIGNILRQAAAERTGLVDPTAIERSAIETGAESALLLALEAAVADAGPLIARAAYVDLLKRLASLRAPVDAFFGPGGVMVMSDDPIQRRNRLALLARLRDLFLQVADISMLPA